MKKIKLHTASGDVSEKEIELSHIFEEKIKECLIYDVVKCYLENQRQGTSKTKTRAEVSGGGHKPFKQKGTGSARAGTNTSPIWVRGGKAHGPKPRDYGRKLGKKVRKQAMRMVLSDKVEKGFVRVVESLEVKEPKTKIMKGIMQKLDIGKEKSLLVVGKTDENVLLSGRNLRNLKIKPVVELNAYDILNNKYLILTQESLKQVSERFV